MDDERVGYAAEFSGLLLERRAEKRITSQRALAEMVGVSEATVGRWERQESFPDAWELRRLEVVLGVTAEQLLHPDPLTERERQVLRRANRTVAASRDRSRADG